MYNGKKIVAIIPARGGSKGLVKKNIRNLAGKPLIGYSIDIAKQSKYVDDVFVSTEDYEIGNVAGKLGAKIIERPMDLAGDNVSTRAVLKHAISVLDCDVVVLLFPTHPLRNVDDIDKLIEFMYKNNGLSACTMREAENHPYWMAQMKEDSLANFFEGDEPIITERQKLPKYFVFGNTAVITRKHLEENDEYFLSRKKNYAIEIPEERCVDIHAEIDLILAETLLNKKNSN